MSSSRSQLTSPARTQPTFAVIHELALRHSANLLPADREWLVSHGLVRWSNGGFDLTSDGHRLHRTLLDRERASVDLARLGLVHEPIASLARRFAMLRADWLEVPTERDDLLVRFHAFVGLAQRPLLRAAAVVGRFEPYAVRLLQADQYLQGGDLRFAVDLEVESIAVVWDELQEDYLQTLGLGHELEAL